MNASKKAFRNGLLAAFLLLLLVAGGYFAFHWFSSAAENDEVGLARQAAEYLGAPSPSGRPPKAATT